MALLAAFRSFRYTFLTDYQGAAFFSTMEGGRIERSHARRLERREKEHVGRSLAHGARSGNGGDVRARRNALVVRGCEKEEALLGSGSFFSAILG